MKMMEERVTKLVDGSREIIQSQHRANHWGEKMGNISSGVYAVMTRILTFM